jgi:heme/copper-type cytochrome/quinol oxidase subunit 2
VVPDPSALLPPAAATPSPFASLIIGLALFVVVIVVIVVVMAVLQAVLPRTDTGAEEVHERELEAERLEQPAGPGPSGEQDGAPGR